MTRAESWILTQMYLSNISFSYIGVNKVILTQKGRQEVRKQKMQQAHMTKKKEQIGKLECLKERKVAHCGEYASSFLSECQMHVKLSTIDQEYDCD